MTTIGYGDIVPHSIGERIVATIAMILGCCVYAYGFTHILELVSHMNKSEKLFREKLDDINQYMRFRKLPMDLRSRIREYVQHTEGGYTEFMNEGRILQGLSPTLRYEVIKHVNTKIIESVPLFQSENKQFIVEMTKVRGLKMSSCTILLHDLISLRPMLGPSRRILLSRRSHCP